jgi:hypothetical protein
MDKNEGLGNCETAEMKVCLMNLLGHRRLDKCKSSKLVWLQAKMNVQVVIAL